MSFMAEFSYSFNSDPYHTNRLGDIFPQMKKSVWLEKWFSLEFS